MTDDLRDIFGPVISAYTREQAIEDGVLADVSVAAQEAGIKYPVALTSAVYERYVKVPEELAGLQDENGRLWDILWMLRAAVSAGRIQGDRGQYEVIMAMPDKGDWHENEKMHEGSREQRLVTLKAVCGPSDDMSPCITVMLPNED